MGACSHAGRRRRGGVMAKKSHKDKLRIDKLARFLARGGVIKGEHLAPVVMSGGGIDGWYESDTIRHAIDCLDLRELARRER